MNVYVFNIGSICIHGKELLRQFAFRQKNRENLTLKKMFDISEKVILGQSDEIFGASQFSWENSTRKQLSLVNGEEVISLSHAKVYVFHTFCVMSWKGESEPNIQILTENRWNSSGIFSQDSLHCSSSTKSKSS